MARPALAGSVTGVAQVQWEDEDEEDEAGDYEEVLWSAPLPAARDSGAPVFLPASAQVRPLANEQHPAPARAQADEQYGDWPRTETSAGAAAGEAVVAADLVTAGSARRVADSLEQSVPVRLLLVTGKEGSCC
uniref:Uncharacterized protein n=1 Tax=Aegilops tauschii TaxID=37682 RepID=R7W298_AEGTA